MNAYKMKTYRKPFYKTYTMLFVGTLITAFIIVLPIMIEHYHTMLNNGVPMNYLIKTWICMVLLPIIILVIFSAVYNSFYVTLSGEGLEIINGIIPLIRKSYEYQYIQKIEIGNKGGFSLNYIQVTKTDKTKSLPWVIGLISKENCKLLANDLKSYGIDTEVTGHLK